MSEFNVVKLSDGADVQIDLEKVRVALKTRKDIKRFLKMNAGDDAYDEWLSNITGLSFNTLEALSREDFTALDQAVARAIKSVIGVNPN